ncbi:MAG TPA: hypothetical protein VGI74_19765 [Streptosporangiaceae bacterium]
MASSAIYDVSFVDDNGRLLDAAISYPGIDDGADGGPGARQNSARNGAKLFFQVSKPGPVTVQWQSSTGADRRFQVFVTRSMVDQPVELSIGRGLVNASAGGTVEVTVIAERVGADFPIVAQLGFAAG